MPLVLHPASTGAKAIAILLDVDVCIHTTNGQAKTFPNGRLDLIRAQIFNDAPGLEEALTKLLSKVVFNFDCYPRARLGVLERLDNVFAKRWHDSV